MPTTGSVCLRPTILPPLPTGPLVRQTATGAQSPRRYEILWPDEVPDYYDKVKLDATPVGLNLETVLKALRVSLPSGVRPFVLLIPRTCRTGVTFTLVLRDVSEPCPKCRPLSDFGLSETIAWEYIACDFLRRCFLESVPLKIKSDRETFNVFLNTAQHFSALHDSLAAAIFAYAK
jgi:hypothetical protein